MLGIYTEHFGRQSSTIGGILLFGKDRQENLPDAIIRLACFQGKTKEKIIDSIEITSALPFAITEGIQFIERHISVEAKIGKVFRKDVSLKSLWPNVLTTVAEFNEVPFGKIISQMGGRILFAIAIIGLVLLLFRKEERKKYFGYAVLLIIWFVATIYSFSQGVRFAILLVPAFAIAFGIGVGILYQFINKWLSKEIHINKYISKTIMIILLCLLLIAPLKSANSTAKNEIPSMNDAWYESLTSIQNDASDAIITSWWDFGHWFYAISEKRVTFDGGNQGERIHWVGKSLLTENEDTAIGILRMLNCGQQKAPHVLEDYLDGDTVKAIDVLNKIIISDRSGAREILSEEGLEDDEIKEVLKYTHCDDLIDQYYITSEDMIGKAGVWGHFGSWSFNRAKMWQTVNGKDITEVHIVGGVHPKMGLSYFKNLIENIKSIRADIHVKAFTAVELDYMCKKAKVSYKDGLQKLKDAGQGSLTGGGAEIFDADIRNQICKDKCTSDEWLEIHKTAHSIGMPSNATIIYGHIEKTVHVIDHMTRLRDLQDKTGGFNAYIPLKFRNGNNQMSDIKEVSIVDDLKRYAISRMFLDNFSHIKAYWPMIGRQTTQLLLSFGVDDIDGTVDDSTKIYTMAGAEEQKPVMTTMQMVDLIKEVGRQPVERDSVYNELKDYSAESQFT